MEKENSNQAGFSNKTALGINFRPWEVPKIENIHSHLMHFLVWAQQKVNINSKRNLIKKKNNNECSKKIRQHSKHKKNPKNNHNYIKFM